MKASAPMIVPREILTLPNPHVRNLTSLLRGDPIPAGLLQAHRVVFICFTNRSGSHHLAELIASTGRANLAGEVFNYDAVELERRHDDFGTLAEYFAYLLRRRSKHGILTCKLSVRHIALLHRAGLLSQLAHRSQFVLMDRGDLLGQAISLEIAMRTRQWTSYMQPARRLQEGSFSFRRISRRLRQISSEQSMLRLFLGMNGRDFFLVHYEHLIQSRQGLIDQLFDWLDVERGAIDPAAMRAERQTGVLNSAWREAFLAKAKDDRSWTAFLRRGLRRDLPSGAQEAGD